MSNYHPKSTLTIQLDKLYKIKRTYIIPYSDFFFFSFHYKFSYKFFGEGIYLMLYRTLGKTGQKVSIIGFGCMRLPIFDGMPDRINKPLATEMIHHAIDEGVNYVDTAYPYHGTSAGNGGMSEILLGNALKRGYRDQV